MMNILLSVASSVFDGAELVLYTLLTHNKNCRIYIFTMEIDVKCDENGGMIHYAGLDEYQRDRLRKVVKYLDPKSKITFIDCLEYYEKYLRGNPNELTAVWLTPYASLRLFADIALSNVDHILYLDCDTAIMGDISHMYNECCNQDVDYCAYVADDARDNEGEMISGVMVLNLNHIRKSGFLDSARRNAMKNGYKYYDQDALRETEIKPYHLPETYAFMHNIWELTDMPKIIHFTNEMEQKIYSSNKSRASFFRRYPFLKYADDGIKMIQSLNIL